MFKKVLIPTDFTIESLNMVKVLLREKQEGKIDILLLHGINLGDSLTNLLYFSKSKMIKTLSNPEFEEACAIIRNKYESKINCIRTDLFVGTSQNIFENYLRTNHVNEAYIPENYQLKLINEKSFDLVRLIENSSIKITKVKEDTFHKFSTKGGLANVFFDNVS